MSPGPRYVPDDRLTLGGEPAPAELRASITSVSHQSGLEGADQVEIELVNENLRWLDHELIRLGKDLKLEIGYADGSMELKESLNLRIVPRVLVRELIPRLNERLTASGSTVGDPRILAGSVVRVEGVGEQFGGLYRVTSATHTLDSGGFQTRFDARKDIWFGSIPLTEQGAVRVGAAAAFAGDFASY